jgi:hypothetical protein
VRIAKDRKAGQGTESVCSMGFYCIGSRGDTTFKSLAWRVLLEPFVHPQDLDLHLDTHSGKFVRSVPPRDHRGDSLESSMGKSRRVIRTAAIYAPLQYVSCNIVDSSAADLPNILFTTNTHLKSAIRLFQNAKPFPHRLAINDSESFFSTYRNEGEDSCICGCKM